ncbi:MAG: hypothetical protein IH985_05325 [Planctomycetes bacterium]|nr:hypothetical protein [Planctomycetota bacterium]
MNVTPSMSKSARRWVPVLVVAAIVAAVLAIVVVRSCMAVRPGSGGAGLANAPSVEQTDDSSAERAVVSFSVIVAEFDPATQAGQNLVAALEAGEKREGVISADRLAAVRSLLPFVTVLTQPGVTTFTGQQCIIGTEATTTVSSGQVVSKQEIKLGLVAAVEDQGALTVAARFHTLDADGRLAVLAQEWGLPFARGRSASASETIRPDEALFMRRRFGGKELLVIVMGRRMQAAAGGDK